MGTVNEPNPRLDQTVRIFDKFYQYQADIPANEYDVVYSYFRSVMDNDVAASNFTTALFQVADLSSQNPLTLLDSFKGQQGVELTASLCYYLNQIRSRATLLGVGVAVVPNFYAVRNVLQ